MPVTNDCTPTVFSFRTAISPSICKVLVDYWGSENILRHPEILVDLGPETLIRINRIGRNFLNQIANALGRFDYIESSELWLRRGKK